MFSFNESQFNCFHFNHLINENFFKSDIILSSENEFFNDQNIDSNFHKFQCDLSLFTQMFSLFISLLNSSKQKRNSRFKDLENEKLHVKFEKLKTKIKMLFFH